VSDIWLVIGTVIIAVIGVGLLAVAVFAVDKSSERREHASRQ